MIKAIELRKLELSELTAKLLRAKKELAVESLKYKAGKSKASHLGKSLRHDIAKIKLVIGEKELL